MNTPQPKPQRLPMSFRFPEDLRELLRQAAEENERSVTAEIVYRIRQSFARKEPSHV
jgi:uncharacterized protein (DUF1778 family)